MITRIMPFVIILLLSSNVLFAQTPEQADAAAKDALLRLEAALGINSRPSSSSGSSSSAASSSGSSASSAAAVTPSAQVTQGGSQPNWVNDPYAVYDRGRYFSAVGQGPNRSQAEARALSALVAIFGQSIQADFTIVTMYEEAVSRGVVNVSENTGIRDTVTRAANLDSLIGAQIGYVWDSGRGTFYAIAYLEKEKAKSIYTDMVIINNGNIADLVNMSNSEKNTFDGLARYRLASQIAGINANYAVIVSQSGGSVASLNLTSADYYRLEADTIFRNITVNVKVENDRANRIQTAFANVVSSQGLRTRGTNPPYILEVFVFSSEAVYPGSNYRWCVMEVSANLIENSTGASLIPFSFNLREGHVSYVNAENRAYQEAERQIAEKFPSLLRGYLQSVMPDR